MKLNRKVFFTYARRAPFGGRLSQQQVDGMEQLLAEWETGQYGDDPRHLSYVLAGVFHETGGRMVPVREGFARTDAEARQVVARRKYGKPAGPYGHVYYGRGRIQNTWLENAEKLSEEFGVDLVKNPDLVLTDGLLDAKITFRGHEKGIWTGHRLSQFFNSSANDPVGARKIVNGKDKANLIAGYYESFLGAVNAANTGTSMPQDVSEKEATPDDVPVQKSPAAITGIGAGVVATVTGILGAVDNVWAGVTLAFLVVSAIVVWYLYSKGQLVLKRADAL